MQHDILVVGSGPLAVAVSRRLAEQQHRHVTILEAGRAVTEPAGSHLRNQPDILRNADGYFDAIQPHLQLVDDSPASPLPGAFESSLVGGQGVLWTNNCPRPAEFERWEAMTPSQWEQRYSEAEKLLGVNAAPAAASRTGQRVRLRLQSQLETEGRSIADLPFAGRFLPSGEIYYNGSWDILAATATDAQRRITIHSEVEVKRLLYQGSRVTGVEVDRDVNGSATVEAATVLLAGGAMGIPRLLHRSGIAPPALGRGISFHALLFGQIVLDSDLCAASDEADLPPRLYIPPTSQCPWQVMVLRDTCPLSPAEKVDNPHQLLEFQAFLPVEFRDENALLIDDAERAAFRFAFSSNDQQHMRAMEADVQRLADTLGRWRRGCESTWVPHGNAHLVGTCRMDRPHWQGVANAAGKVHGFDNLYLASVGLFPVPIAENPTLTALALALNSCDEY